METSKLVKKVITADFLGGLFILYILQLVGYKVYRAFVYPYYVSPLRHLPGPKDHHFLVGQTINQFKSGSPNEPFVSWTRQWAREPFIRYFTMGNSEALLVTSLAAVREILQDKCYSFQKPAFFIRLIINITGYGLVLAEGEHHKKQRKALNGMFSLANLKTLIPVFRSKAQNLSDAFDKAIETDNDVVSLVSMYSKTMLDIMGVFGLGLELQNLTSGNTTSFHDCYREIFEPGIFGQILVAINGYIPLRWLPVDANRRYLRATETVHQQIGDIIKERIQEVKQAREGGGVSNRTSRKAKDLLTFMVEEKYFADDGNAWSEQEILHQILTFMPAGHETTAGALTWATYALTQYPDVAKRLREEIGNLLRDNPTPDYSDMESLPYLNNFMRELLRWRCPAVSVPREASEDVVIQGIRIPKGTTVIMHPAVIHHNPAIWGDDCDDFDPDRWDRLEGETADPYSFAAFSIGPRMCIGRVMAVIEFKVILIGILTKFEFEAVGSGGEPELMNPSPLLRPMGGLKVRVKRLAVSNN